MTSQKYLLDGLGTEHLGRNIEQRRITVLHTLNS